MCFNAEVSLSMYVIGTIGYIMLYLRGYAAEAMLYACVIQMQLIEYLLWINQENVVMNKLVTKLGILVNHIEPIVFWIGIKTFGIRLPQWVDAMMIGYIICTLVYTHHVLVWNVTEETRVSEESKPHLHWKWNEGRGHGMFYIYFLIILYVLSVYGLPKTNGQNMKHGLVVFVSFMSSYALYGSKHSVGAMWCFMAAFVPWILPLLYNF